MMATAQPNRLDYRESEQAACARFGVESVMGQDGLLEVSERATPGMWARYYIEYAHIHHPIFIASAIDAMLHELSLTSDRSDLDAVRQAINIAQHEPWSCACIEYHIEDYGDWPGEKFVAELLRQELDLELVHRNRESITRAPDEAE